MSVERACRFASCDLPSIGSKPYCPTHWREARRWLKEQAKLDSWDDARERGIARNGVDWSWERADERA